MSLETVCSECGQRVGVVRAPSLGGEPPRYKVAVHAIRPPDWRKGKRPRCPGAGYEPDPLMLTTTTDGREERRRANTAAWVAG